jgi:hypothetical protein
MLKIKLEETRLIAVTPDDFQNIRKKVESNIKKIYIKPAQAWCKRRKFS